MSKASPLERTTTPAASLRPPKSDLRTRSALARGWLSRILGLRLRRGPLEPLVRFPCGDGLSLGCSPTLAHIEDLVRKVGLRSLVNLNTEGEPGEILSPNVEASWAHALDLRHERASFAAELPLVGAVDRFLHALGSVPRPVFVHSLNGRRAAAMILVHLGLAQGSSGAAAVKAARGLGITCTLDSLQRFAESEVDRRMALLGSRRVRPPRSDP